MDEETQERMQLIEDEYKVKPVIATHINKYEMFYECPCCWTRYKKNGEPYKNAKRTIHRHGNNGDPVSSRITRRTSHCPKMKGDIFIVVNETTKRLN